MDHSRNRTRFGAISAKTLRNKAICSAAMVETLEIRTLFTASWTALTNGAPAGVEAMVLLSNGSVMAQNYGDQGWELLTPTSTGSYLNGTWSWLSNAPDTRTYYSTQVLQSGNVYIAGGEYGTGGANGAIYNTLTNTWTAIPSGVGSYIDADSEILANGVVLEAPVYPASSGYTYLYNPTTNAWTTGPKLYRGSDADEQNWVKLSDGSILAPDGKYTSERYIPATNTWINDGTTTVAQTDSLGEFGQGVLLPDGQAFYVGTGSTTELYTPSGYNSSTGMYYPAGTNGTTPGTWSAGPTLPGSLGTDDAPIAELPDGNVLFTVGPIDSYSDGNNFYIYNYQTNTIALSPGAPSEPNPPYENRFLDLPDGTVLMSVDGQTLYDYKDGGTAVSSGTPTITSIVPNSNGSYLLTGTGLTGISEGAYYGDDAQMNSNYPIVRLTSSGGTEYFARTFNWSTSNVDTGNTPVTTNFTLPLGLPAGNYTLNVMVNGFVSANYAFTTPSTADTAPTITTAASASPSAPAAFTTTLSVAATGQSALTYTWSITSAPADDSTPSFSTNGTTTSNSVVATFQHAGSYTFKVTATDTAGLSASSSVTVVVSQTMTSVKVAPTAVSPATPPPSPVNLTAGQTQQFGAIAYDQFGDEMATQPSFTWSMTGGGSVSSSGLYTSPSSGTLAELTATTGSFSATVPVYVVSSPWVSADIGSPGVNGSAFNTVGTFNVSGSGLDVYNTADHFHYVYQPLGGDGEITVRVATEPEQTTAWEKAGVMIRATLADDSQQADISVTPGNGIAFQYRNTSGGSSANVNGGTYTAPYWVKLVRSGNLFTGYYSANGTTWTKESSTTIAMTGTVYIGMFLTSQSNTVADTVTFDNVSLLDASPDTLNATAGIPATLNVLANDTGPAGDTLTLTAVSQPAKGTVTFNSSGGVTYTASSTATGTDSFTYTISDGQGDTATSTVSVAILGMIAYYKFDEGTGTTTADATGDGYTGTVNNATWTTGITGTSADYGLAFNGTSSDVTFTNSPSLGGTTNFAVGAWVRTTSTTGGTIIQQRDANGYEGEYAVSMGTSGTVSFYIYNSSYQFQLTSTAKVNDGKWHQIIAMRNGSAGTIYIDGVSSASGSGTIQSLTSTITVGIGADIRGPGSYFNGTIDDVMVYNTALTAAQIASISTLTPTVATAAAASPSTVTGNTTALSVLGADFYTGEIPLTYTWAATTIPTGATTPTFSVNGTNAASSSTATFYKAGSYVFTVTIAEGTATTTSTVSVTVGQTATSIAVTPASASLASHGSQTFTAVEDDQFGNAMSSQPTFSWSSTGSGSVNASTGAYLAGYATGTATVTATAGGFSKSAAITITNTAPVISSAASASPASVSATTANLSVSATDDGGADLTYGWATTGTPPAAVSFSANNTSTSNATVATFTRAGSYTLQATVTDAGGLSTTSSVTVIVNQTLTTAVVAPASVTLHENATQTFTATGYDQFGNALSTQPTFTWSKTAGVGSINSSSGVYTSPASPGSATVVAASGSITSSSASVTVNNAGPTIATPASATPSPATGNTTALSVLGADDGGESALTYTWTATAMPTGATAPTYSSNGVNASRNSTATFYEAGSYTFTVTVSDGQGGTTSSSVSVTVNQTLTTITVTPSSTTIAENATQAFSAGGYDQFGNALASQPSFSWSKTAGIGSVNAGSGVYTAPASTGSATVTATSGSISGNASVTVQYTGPSIATAASATPSPVTGTTTALSVLGSESTGESNLSYTWSATTIPAGASTPTYSINGTNAAKNTTATFYQAGSYTFLVTVTDGQGGSATSSVSVTVNQAISAIVLSNSSVVAGGTSQATAEDQFSKPMAANPGWSLNGGGSMSNTGLFTAASVGGTYTITADVNSSSVNTNVTVVPTAYAGTTGNDTYALRVSPTNSTMEQIFVNTAESGSPTYTVSMSQLSSLSFNTASDGTLTVDFSNGNPLPAGGITYNGGSGLFVEGASAGGLAFTINANKLTDTAADSSPITYSSVSNIELDLAGGSNTLTQLAQPAGTVTFNAGPGNNTLNVSGGSYTFNTDPAVTSGNLTVIDNAAVVFAAPTAGSGYNARNLAALNVGSSGTATLTASTTATDRTVLETGSLSIAKGGTLDIGNNAMIVHNGDLPTITTLVKSGLNAGGGYWNGTGITSSSARSDTTLLNAVGVISNNLSGGTLDTTFDNQPAVLTDVLIKYTYYGDTNLNGEVDASDYSRIDSGYLTHATGWFNGDFNYDGNVDGSDYTLVDNAFNTQGAQEPTQPPAPAVVNPVAYYKFNDGVTATTTTDSTGDGFTGKIHGATVTTGVDDTTGLAFNGTSDYVSLPSLDFTGNTVTLSGWIERNGSQTTGAGLIDNAGNGLTIGSDNSLSYSWGKNASTAQFDSHLTIPNDQWTFVALVASPTGATLYMQPEGGELASATSPIANPSESFNGETDLGKNGNAYFNGSMDEVCIYKQALSYEQILTVADLAPVITSPAVSIPSADIAIQTELQVAATSQAGAANLIYTWEATTVPYGGSATFTANGTNSAYDTIATGTVPGTYVFTVTVSDPGHLSTTSSVSETFDSNPFDIAEINYPAAPRGGGIQPLNLGNFVVDSRTPDDFNSNDNAADRYVYVMDSLTIVGPYSQVDIGNNDLIIHSTSAADAQETYNTVNGYVNSGYGQGGASNWTYGGIISSLAANAGLGRSAITVILNAKSKGQPIYTTFDGQAVTATDVLVRYNG